MSAEAKALIRGMLRRTGGWGVASDPRVRLGAFNLREAREITRAHLFWLGILGLTRILGAESGL